MSLQPDYIVYTNLEGKKVAITYKKLEQILDPTASPEYNCGVAQKFLNVSNTEAKSIHSLLSAAFLLNLYE